MAKSVKKEIAISTSEEGWTINGKFKLFTNMTPQQLKRCNDHFKKKEEFYTTRAKFFKEKLKTLVSLMRVMKKKAKEEASELIK